MTPTLVYDIETENWTTFVLGATYNGRELKIYRNEKDLIERLVSNQGPIVAHNGGRFDHLWALDAMARHGYATEIDAKTNGSGIVSLKFGDTELLDSARLYPMRLADLSGGSKLSIADLCDCGKECGGYCRINHAMPRAVRKRVEDYCAEDAKGLWDGLAHMRTIADECGLELGHTIGATAWRNARNELDLPNADFELRDWEAMREGYLGGRCEVWRVMSRHGFMYDINSAYPWALANVDFPWQFVGVLYGSDASRALLRQKPGIYSATVRVPDSFIPVLPCRTAQGIAYPIGTINGTWPLNEIEYARTQGCRILKVHRAAVFKTTRRIFKPWIERLFAVRMKYGKDTREGKWLKLVPNSLSGKLGTKSITRRLKIYPDIEDLKNCDCEPETPDDCRCGAYRPIDNTGRVWEAMIGMRNPEGCAHAAWAAYLTGEVRIKVHRFAKGSSPVYTDTDSLYCEKCLDDSPEVGNELGQWKALGPYRNMEVLAPKVYRYDDDKGITIGAKGIPIHAWEPNVPGVPSKWTGAEIEKRKAEFWERLVEGNTIEWQRMAGLRSGTANFFARIPSQRRVTANTGRRFPGVYPLTRPPRDSELE